MASWRKDLPDLLENLGEEESDGDNNSTGVHQAFSRRYSPASFDSYSLDNDKEQSEFDKDSSESNTGVSEQSEVGSSTKKNRKKKRKGRRSVWEERHVNDLVDVICSSEYYKKKLIWMGRYRWMDGLFCLLNLARLY